MKSGFFNSVSGDRKYDADDISSYFLKLISNGVFATPADSLQVQANGGMSVKVTPGWAFVNCKWLRLDTNYVINLDKSDIQYNRLDRIVVRLDPSESVRSVTIALKKGTAKSPTPIVPLTREKNGIWELSLAQVWVFANSTEIKQSAIVDKRGNTDVCGWVTGLIDQIDTTNLFAQYDAAFKEFMEGLENGKIIDDKSVGNKIKTTLAKFIPMLFGYTCEVLNDWDYFPGYLNGYGISREVYDVNNGDVVMIWHNGELLMNKEDYFLSGGDPQFWRVVTEKNIYGGNLTIQIWHPPTLLPSITDRDKNPGVMVMSGSANSDLDGGSTETITGTVQSEIPGTMVDTVIEGSTHSASGSAVQTVSGKSEKLEE